MSHQFLLIAGAALAIMIAASVFSRRTGVAAPLLLVGLGIVASSLPVIDVRRNIQLIGWLSVVMVVVSAVAIGAVVHWVFPVISFPLGVALGAVVAPTDAVAATAIGRRVGLPPRVMAVLEGESLVNDASALVTLRTGVAVIASTTQFSVGGAVFDFVWAVIGAILAGLVVGQLTVLLRQRLDDPVLNTTISFAVPFLAFFPAEEVGASGVLAVVVAGLVTGAQGSRRFSARDRQTQAVTWTTVSFVLESAVFLGMGYQLPGLVDAARDETSYGEMAGLVAIVLVLLVGLRFLGLAWPVLNDRWHDRDAQGEAMRSRLDQFEEKLDSADPSGVREEQRIGWARKRLARDRADIAFEEREPITNRGLLVIAWAGMRGVVTVAAAQTIPSDAPHAATVVLAAYLVALVTLVIFGLTLPALIRRLGFDAQSPDDRFDAVSGLMRRIGSQAIDELGPLEEQTYDGAPLDPSVVEMMKQRILPRLVAGVNEKRRAAPGTVEQTVAVQQRYVDAMRDALASERSIGAYSSHTFRQVESLLDSLERRAGGGADG